MSERQDGGLEDKIPPEGINAAYVSEYNPSNSGIGDRYKKEMKPLYQTSE